uniref:Uncharacterized protein MANES_01G101700 n=1 Tax=Rhizophora mucronata TaxID=61149 RepID=A0A2P2MKN9_RHIMU
MKCPTFLLVSGLLVVLLTLVSPKACVASSNITTSLGMSMGESNLDLEFVMGSEFGRLLASTSAYGLDASTFSSRQPFNCGGRGLPYCVKKEMCATYTRDCK